MALPVKRLVLGMAVAAGVYFLYAKQSRDLDRLHASVAELKGQLEESHDKGPQASVSGPTLASVQHVAPSSPGDPGPIPVTRSAAPRAPTDRAGRERFQRLDAEFQSQARDAKWSSAAERAIRDTLRNEGFAGTALLNAQCAETVCRVELEHDSVQARQSILVQLTQTAPFNTDGFIWPRDDENRDGRVTTVIFVARDGTGLPSDDPA